MDLLRIAVLCCTVAVVAASSIRSGLAQGSDPLRGLNDEQKRSLEVPFKGLTTNGQVMPGLFAIRQTGVSTSSIRQAAQAFLNGLSAGQRGKASFPVDDREWRLWINTPAPARQGVSFEEMSEPQRELAFGLLRASLSAKGLKQTEDIMKLNETFAEISNRPALFGQWKYWITVMGTPSDTEPWGWQMDGHHCIINYFVLGDQVVMTPTFMGSEPVRADAGKFKGTWCCRTSRAGGGVCFEPDRGPAGQGGARAPRRPARTRWRPPTGTTWCSTMPGFGAANWTTRSASSCSTWSANTSNNMPAGHARLRMEEVRQHLPDTYFAWIGATDPAGVFYYRVHSPVILVEFDHQAPVATREPRAQPQPHPHRDADPQRQRLRQGSAAAALHPTSALTGAHLRYPQAGP